MTLLLLLLLLFLCVYILLDLEIIYMSYLKARFDYCFNYGQKGGVENNGASIKSKLISIQ
jgi:hypothetical protein